MSDMFRVGVFGYGGGPSVIAILMIKLTWDFGVISIDSLGYLQSIGIAIFTLLALQRWKIHPAIIIVLAFVYGGLVLSHSVS